MGCCVKICSNLIYDLRKLRSYCFKLNYQKLPINFFSTTEFNLVRNFLLPDFTIDIQMTKVRERTAKLNPIKASPLSNFFQNLLHYLNYFKPHPLKAQQFTYIYLSQAC